MASKKSRPLDDPPAASASEEEEDSSSSDEEEVEKVTEKPQSKPQPKQHQPQSEEEESEEEEGEEEEGEEDEEEEESDDEEEQKKTTQKKTQPSKKTPQPEPDSDTESESLKSPRASDFTIKPIKSSGEKPESGTPVSKPSVKRRVENGGNVGSKSKKAKPSSEEEEEGGGTSTPAEKKFSINRLWSEEDELEILKGLIEFQANTGKDPSTHQQDFHEFVKKSLHVDASKSQVMDKVRRLKTKFKTNMNKSTNGEDPTFSKPHEYKSFQLSKKIWGSSEKNGVDDSEKTKEKSGSRSSKKSSNDKLAIVDANANTNAGVIKEEDLFKGKSDNVGLNEGSEEDELGKKYPYLMTAFRPDYISNMAVPELLKDKLNLVGSSELKEMDNKWKKQNAAEVEAFLGRIDLLREQTRIVLDAMKSSKN